MSGAPDVDYRILPLGPAHPGTAAAAARLHGQLLGHSPVALLGVPFMENFYYRDLPALGLVFGAVAYIDGQPAGFMVGTADSSGFMQKAIRRKWPAIGWIMARSVLADPRRLAAVWEAVQIMRNLPPAVKGDGEPVGEILSFGVLPAFRTREFMMRRRLRVSQDLLGTVVAQLRAAGVSKTRVIVDADNLEARLFYLGNGWQPGLAVVPGWRKKTVEFLWTDMPGVTAAALSQQ